MNAHGPLQDVTGLTGRPVPGAHRRTARPARARTARRILVSALVAASLGSAAAVSLASSTSGQAAGTHQLARVPAGTLRGPWMLTVPGGRASVPQP